MDGNSDYQMRLVIRCIFSLYNILGGSDGKEYACNARDPGSTPGSRRSPGEENGNPNSVTLPGESHGQRSLKGYSP